jgi:hypothetical protein
LAQLGVWPRDPALVCGMTTSSRWGKPGGVRDWIIAALLTAAFLMLMLGIGRLIVGPAITLGVALTAVALGTPGVVVAAMALVGLGTAINRRI